MTVHRNDTLSMALTGDVIQTRPLSQFIGITEEFTDLFAKLRGADATIGNLEVLVHDYEGYPAATSGGTYMRSPPRVLDDLVDLGFDGFSAATNHTFDYSHGGVEATIENLVQREIPFAGIGHTLFEARQPEYVEIAAGRVGIVSACTSFTPGAEAGERSPVLSGRPGLNPIHVSRVYRLPTVDIELLKWISETAGIEAIKQDWFDRSLLYGHDWADDRYFHFGDMKFQETDDDARIVHQADEDDVDAYESSITDAARNADRVVATIHTHQGTDGLGKTSETPQFLIDLARRAIDAGADAVVSHGPHVLRGIETYRHRPIFYSLGNFVVQNETVSRLPPESFQRYNLEEYTRVADVFEERLYDENGDPKGDLADERFWRTVVPVCEFSDSGLEVKLHPCTLQGDADRPQRGTPILATGNEADEILAEVNDLSNRFDTEIEVNDGVGRLSM